MSTRNGVTRRRMLAQSAKIAGAVAACRALTGYCQVGRAPGPAVATGREPLSDVDAFNYVIGTQNIGATYQFTSESLLVETARAVLDMGSNIFKFTMGRGYQRMMLRATKAAYQETVQYLLNQGADAKERPRHIFPGASPVEPPADPDIRTLVDLARLEPSYRRVFDMPFAYYLIWTYAFTPNWWHLGFSQEDQEKEYKEVHALASYLLRTFSGTRKTFLLGHWEGDWHLRPELNVRSDDHVRPEAIQGMVDWLNTRQRAIDDAKRDTPHHDVALYHYCEVNHVAAVSMEGRVSVTNSVLPKTDVDYVSYSIYDCLSDAQNKLPKALDYVESKLPSKPSVPGKRVFIGEYGFPARRVPETERDRKSREVMRIGFEWGCPFILCWQMYNNEFKAGVQNGYWLIDDHGVKQPLWHTHHRFYQSANRYVSRLQKEKGRLPSYDEFRKYAVNLLR